MSPSTKLKLYNVCILPIMLYGSECWALSRVDARKVDALDQWCLRRILDIRWYQRVSNCEVRRLTEQPPLTSIIQKRRLTLLGHLVRMDESTDARRILTAVPQSEWRRPLGRPYTSWMATMKNDLARHNLTLEDAIEQALNKPLWMPNNDDDDDLQRYLKEKGILKILAACHSGAPFQSGALRTCVPCLMVNPALAVRQYGRLS